ncbi:MAG TPA: HD domain-containing protein [Patescibacteria group bacterium]|nr:HD domain-containing protein [Patescibacteria group bacterium]
MQRDQVLNHPAVKQSIDFVNKSFEENPHYSFNDWHIMADHSVQVMNYALQIADGYPVQVDPLVIALAALFHDIGKVVHADEQTLLEKHEELGREVTNDLLNKLDLTEKQKQKIQDLFSLDDNSLEKQIVKDADYVDFFINETLHKAAKKWADEENQNAHLKRKFDRFERMLPESKKLARPFYEKLKEEWEADLNL